MSRVTLSRDNVANRGAQPRRQRRVERFQRVLCLLLVLVVLAACGSSGKTPDDRSFANDPAKQTAQAPTAPPTPPNTPTPPPTPPASPAALLSPRGAPARFYVAISGQLLAISGQGAAKRITLPAGAELLGFDWSPNGDQIAVAVGARDKKSGTTAVSLLVIDKEGKTVRTLRNLLTLPAPTATPTVTAGISSSVLVDWGLVDNQIAIATHRGALLLIPAKGEPKSFPFELKGQSIRSMRISPRGDSAAILSVDAAGRGTVALVSLADGKAQSPKPLVGYAVDNQHSVTAFAWLSDGQRLLFTQAGPTSDPTTGGELYLVNTRTLERSLIDTGGRAGPAGGIISFAPAPDAKTVAYVIGIDEGTTWLPNSLWVRSLRGPGQVPVPIGNAQSIDGLWWTLNGLVWAVRVDSGDGGYQMVFFLQPPTGSAHELVRVSVKPGAAATPIATPVASPVASPSVSPVATPGR